MKLATLKDGTRDGRLIVVSRSLDWAAAPHEVRTLQAALDQWCEMEPILRAFSQALDAGQAEGAFPFDPTQANAPLPRAYHWCDGSAFLHHGKLMQTAFDLPPIEDEDTIPLLYQGGSDDFLGPTDDVKLPSEEHGIDFEGEFGVILDDVEMGCPADRAGRHVKLIVLLNDFSLRRLQPREMKTGFGFYQCKPSTSFAPVAVTPDELGDSWKEGRVDLDLHVTWNQSWFGHPHGGEMTFSFHQLIAHAARTRRLRAGTLIGSGTLSNADRSRGSACISERRAIETIEQGVPVTGFMRFGDSIRLEAFDRSGTSPFGAIDQKIVPHPAERR
jgi:fumarylacetoacetate (FAA) hydrolase